MSNILVLEDLEDSFAIIKQSIGNKHAVTWAQSIGDAKRLINDSFNLLILDVGLPDGDGYEFCRWVKDSNHSQIPIIFVSARDSIESCITGLASGGDDYIYKPFHPAELMARIEAKLRANKTLKQKSVELNSNGIVINLQSHKAFLVDNGHTQELDLTPIEFKILQIFLEEPGSAKDRNEILDRVWGKNVYVYSRSVDTHVSKLRKKLASKGDLISSVHGKGYRFGGEN